VPAPAATAQHTAEPIQSEPLTVLLVEDQPGVAAATRRMLEALDHRVLRADAAEGALRLMESHGDQVSLVLADVALGNGPSGPELAEELHRRRPDLPVVFMSGYDAILDAMPLEAGHDFIQKPFRVAQLREVLARRLRGHGRGRGGSPDSEAGR
jgi:DNA-binding NtrC family response regulator